VPDGFSPVAPIFETNGVMYPGLMDLHNHLPYNVFPLWKVPKQFSNRSEWRAHPDYKRNVSAPAAALNKGGEPILKAIVRYVEVKLLMGGATSGQGMRAGFAGKLYEGMVRNFERPMDGTLPKAETRLDDVVTADDIESFKALLNSNAVMLHHLCEGVDATTREVYLRLKSNDLIRSNLVGIHSLALHPEDFSHMAEKGARVVWSPLSNSILYGKSIDPTLLADAKIPFCLGSDWTPSGSRNLLLELKAAWLHSQADGGPNCARLCEAVTNVAAASIGWGDSLGTLEPNKLADIVVVDRRVADPFENLVRATERDVKLVLIEGVPRYGDAALFSGFNIPNADLEPLTIGARKKKLFTQQPGSPLGNLTFSKAADVLREAMSHLDALPVKALHASALNAGDGASFVDFDMQGDELLLPNAMDGLALDADGLPQAADVTSIPLDPPTVIDDLAFFDTLESIGHLPAFLKGASGLRGLYA
jgi:hypothetical protein